VGRQVEARRDERLGPMSSCWFLSREFRWWFSNNSTVGVVILKNTRERPTQPPIDTLHPPESQTGEKQVHTRDA